MIFVRSIPGTVPIKAPTTPPTEPAKIDFILTRRGEASGPAKLAGPVVDCPVGEWRDTGHYPVQAAGSYHILARAGSNAWHHRARALVLPLQLPRFAILHNRTKKTQQQYHHTHTVRIPIFSDSESLHVRWQDYTVLGYIRHHGSSVTSGHYTTLRVNGADWWSLDDAKAPCLLTAEQLIQVQRNMYLVILVLPQPFSAAIASHPGDSRHASSSSEPHSRRTGLGCQPSAPARLPAQGALGGNAALAASVQRLDVSNHEVGAAHGVDSTAQQVPGHRDGTRDCSSS